MRYDHVKRNIEGSRRTVAARKRRTRSVMNLEMFVTWVLVGLLTGWLVGFVMKAGGYGLISDLMLGLVGEQRGEWDLFGPRHHAGAKKIPLAALLPNETE